MKIVGKDLYQNEPTDEFFDAIFAGDVAAVSRHLENGRAANENVAANYPALRVAVEGGSSSVVKLLLKNGAEVNNVGSEGYTALHHAVENTVDTNGDEYVLVGKEETDIVACLLDAGADVHLLTERGNSSIDIAEENGFEEIVTLLLLYA